MIEHDIKKILKELKNVSPDPGFTARSRRIVLSSKNRTSLADFWHFKNYLEVARLGLTVGLTAILIFAIFGGVSFINQRFSPIPAGLNQSLITEAEEVNSSIQIALNEVAYLDQSNSQTIKTIEKVASAKPEPEKEAPAKETATSAEIVDQEIYNLLDQASQ